MSKPVPEVQNLAHAIFAANGTLIEVGNIVVSHLGLTSAWWQVMAALDESSVPLPVASIARNMGLTRQAVQRIVDLLADQGLVAFETNPHHQRAKLVNLTPAGLKAVKAAENSVGPIDQAILKRVGVKRLREALQTLEELTQVLAEKIEEKKEKP